MKPILFNTKMVRAILAGRKNVTRRVVKPPALDRLVIGGKGKLFGSYDPDVSDEVYPTVDDGPYQTGDILYVREAWQQNYDGSYSYRAGHKFEKEGGWRPSIHMPREAARIFLRVTDVQVERLQAITIGGMLAEGVIPNNTTGGQWQQWQTDYMKPVWDSTVKEPDRSRYGWDANPWVWVIAFGRISKEEVEHGNKDVPRDE